MATAISVEHLSKIYRLGQIGTGTFTNDMKVWWAKMRGKPNPLLRIGETDHGNRDGEDLWALKDVSFQVAQGEVLGIIGRNGAGKSTLLKILSRVTAPSSGKVKIRGRVASLLEVGTGFHPDLTGRENIYLNGAILGMDRREINRKLDEIVDFAEIEKFIDTPVKRYSSGMYVRLAFAVAAHLEPEILVVDEVLAVGDAAFQQKCLGKMGSIAIGGRTVLFVSHNLGAINNLCNDAMLLSNGEVQVFGETREVVESYKKSVSPQNDESTKLTRIFLSDFEHSGSGDARIMWAEMLNSKEEHTMSIRMDEQFHVRFAVDNPHLISLTYAIEILDENDYPLFHIWSGFDQDLVEDKKRGGRRETLDVTIPPLNLFPDSYYMNLWIGSHTRRVDKIEKCFRFRVLKDETIREDLLTSRGRLFKKVNWNIIRETVTEEWE